MNNNNNNNNNEWLQQLKVGDKVIVYDDYYILKTVHRITNTQIVIQENNYANEKYEEKYKKSNGRKIGCSEWKSIWLLPATEENILIADIRRLTKKASYLIEHITIPKTKPELEDFILVISKYVKESPCQQKS